MLAKELPSPPLDSSSNEIDTRISALNASLVQQCASLPTDPDSIEQIVHLISDLFQCLRKDLQLKEKLSNDYADLSNSMQMAISNCAQYLRDRYDQENELVLLKHQISQVLGQIGSTQHRLAHYRTIIDSLEHEGERLEILLNNPQLMQINRQNHLTIEGHQRIELDRLMVDNDKIRLSIAEEKDAIELIQKQIERDVQELHVLSSTLSDLHQEHQSIDDLCSKRGSCAKIDRLLHDAVVDKNSTQREIMAEKIQQMENEYRERRQTTIVHYDLLQQKYNTLLDTQDRTIEQFSRVRAVETTVGSTFLLAFPTSFSLDYRKHGQSQRRDRPRWFAWKLSSLRSTHGRLVSLEQTRTSTQRGHIEILRHETHRLDSEKRSASLRLMSEQHTNHKLERRQLMLGHHQSTLSDRVRSLTEQLTHVTNRNQAYEATISTNNLRLQDVSHKITSMESTVKKLGQYTTSLEKLLQDHRYLQMDEQEKLRSLKQASCEKRNELLLHTKQLRRLSLEERHAMADTIRTTLDIERMSLIRHQSEHAEKVPWMAARISNRSTIRSSQCSKRSRRNNES